MIEIKLTEDQMDKLLLVLGYKMGIAMLSKPKDNYIGFQQAPSRFIPYKSVEDMVERSSKHVGVIAKLSEEQT